MKGSGSMYKITVGIDGMMCSMCESHINETIRKSFDVSKVTSSHTKNQTVITSEKPISEAEIHSAIDPTGYTVTSYAMEEAEENKKKGLFGLFGK